MTNTERETPPLTTREARRIAFDDNCFGWLLDDHSFEPLPMPLEWQGDIRAYQILTARYQWYGCTDMKFERDAHYPSREEKLAPVRGSQSK